MRKGSGGQRAGWTAVQVRTAKLEEAKARFEAMNGRAMTNSGAVHEAFNMTGPGFGGAILTECHAQIIVQTFVGVLLLTGKQPSIEVDNATGEVLLRAGKQIWRPGIKASDDLQREVNAAIAAQTAKLAARLPSRKVN